MVKKNDDWAIRLYFVKLIYILMFKANQQGTIHYTQFRNTKSAKAFGTMTQFGKRKIQKPDPHSRTIQRSRVNKSCVAPPSLRSSGFQSSLVPCWLTFDCTAAFQQQVLTQRDHLCYTARVDYLPTPDIHESD